MIQKKHVLGCNRKLSIHGSVVAVCFTVPAIEQIILFASSFFFATIHNVQFYEPDSIHHRILRRSKAGSWYRSTVRSLWVWTANGEFSLCCAGIQRQNILMCALWVKWQKKHTNKQTNKKASINFNVSHTRKIINFKDYHIKKDSFVGNYKDNISTFISSPVNTAVYNKNQTCIDYKWWCHKYVAGKQRQPVVIFVVSSYCAVHLCLSELQEKLCALLRNLSNQEKKQKLLFRNNAGWKGTPEAAETQIRWLKMIINGHFNDNKCVMFNHFFQCYYLWLM